MALKARCRGDGKGSELQGSAWPGLARDVSDAPTAAPWPLHENMGVAAVAG